MSWASEKARKALYILRDPSVSDQADVIEGAIRETVEECARRAHGVAANWPPHGAGTGAGTGPVGALAVRDQIRAMLEDT